MKVALVGEYPENTVEKFRAILPADQFEVLEINTPEKYLALTEADCMVLRIFKATNADMDRIKGLRLISRWGAGYDSVDIEEAGKRGIWVTNTPGANAYAVSEHTVLLMLAVYHNLLSHTQSLQSGVWSKTLFTQRTLNKRLLGLIGGGNIGRMVAQKVRSFGAEVQYYDVYRLPEEMEREYHMRYVPFEMLLRTSDIVSLHLPLTAENRHLIGQKEFDMMKRGCVLINAARGGLIDETALLHALQTGKILGAGIDCVEQEPLPENSPLLSHPNIVVTPHIGGDTSDIAEMMIPMLAENILALQQSREITCVVNRQFLRAEI